MKSVSNAGRKRKAGERYPSGDLRPTITLNQIRRGRDAMLAAGKNSWLGSQLGWLAIAIGPDGHPLITAAQCEAGLAFANLFHAYCREMGFPARAARTCALDGVRDGVGSGEADDALLASYRAARGKLEAVGAFDVVVAVCVDDQAPARWELARLIKGLDALRR